MVNVKIYVEGGGERNGLRTECRRGYSQFLEKAGLKGHMPKIIACGTRRHAYDDFCTALKAAKGDCIILLVDSEDPIQPGSNKWNHVKNRDGWNCPNGAIEENIHFMVQCLEAWFMADKETLAKFYGDGFAANSLSANLDIQAIPKQQLFSSLDQATKDSNSKGKYHKGNHAFAILALISPDKVARSSPYAAGFIDTVKNRCI